MSTGQWPPVPLSGTITTSKTVSCVNQINDGGPAYPVPSLAVSSGMTIRQYAAIKLCVPDSGLPWLDEMIVKSNRQRFAAAALKGQAHRFAHPHEYRELLAQDCYDIADAMLKAREAK